ncbi:MAG: flippase-like domain-containing protein [Ignavibacteria bacterium]|nr:flippase-like domain-containing protein [Ignavibacteria bacterium]
MTSDNLILSKFSRRDFLFFIFSLLFGIALLIYTFRGVSLNEVTKYFYDVNIFYAVILLLIIFLGSFLRAWRWMYMLESLKSKISLKNLFLAVIFGYGVNVILPRFGEIGRAVFIGNIEKISRVSALGTVVIERIIDLIFLIFSVLIALYLYGDVLSVEYPWIMSSIYFGVFILVLAVSLLALVIKFQNRLLVYLEKIFGNSKLKVFDLVTPLTVKIINGFDSIKSLKNYFNIIALSVLMWFTYGLGAYVGLFMMNMQKILPVDLTTGWIIMSITTFGVMIPTPGSTGSYHAFCKSVLTMIVGFEVQISLAYAVITHLFNTVPFVIISVILLATYRKKDVFKFDGKEQTQN